jgi:type VII secretion protein EccB
VPPSRTPPSAPTPSRSRPTPGQVHAHRFAVRRLAAALVGRDPTLRRDPGRTQNRALAVGAVLAALAALAALVVGLVRGDADWRSRAIVRGEPSGALYVVAHDPDRLVPTLNLASARLLAAGVDPDRSAREPPQPAAVRDDALADAPRTAPAGIPGAPSVLPDPAAPVPAAWAVCDAVRLDPAVPDPAARPERVTAVLGGLPALGRPLAGGEALLARGDDGVVWLVADGRRARLDPAQGSVVRALGLTGARPRVAGTAFLGALPEGAPVVPVVVPGTGAAPTDTATRALAAPVGAVVSPGADRFFLVADRGVQEVPAVVAQLARFANPDPAADPGVATVAPAALAAVPRTAVVDLDAYPRAFPRPVDYGAATVVCARPGTDGGPAAVTTAPALPTPTPPVPLGSGAGGAVDGAQVAGAGAYVVPVGPGEAPDPGRGVLVDPAGTVFTVPGVATAAALGLGVPTPAPRAVLDLLPRGPALDPDSARLLR